MLMSFVKLFVLVKRSDVKKDGKEMKMRGCKQM